MNCDKLTQIASSARMPVSALLPSLAIVSRVIAAVIGGYGVATLAAVGLGLALPLPQAAAVMVGMLVSIPVWVGAWLWAFATASAARAWLWLGPPAVVGTLIWSLSGAGMP